MTWRPVLWGAEAARVRCAADAAIEVLAALALEGGRSGLAGGTGADLASGWAGIALALAVARHDDPTRVSQACVDAAASRAVDEAAALGLSASLYSGVVGVSWALARIEALAGDEADDEASGSDDDDDVTVLVARLLSLEAWPGPFDLVRGLAGLAVHVADEPPSVGRSLRARRIVHHLAALSRSALDGRWWLTDASSLEGIRPTMTAAGEADLGVAHGAAGVAAALTALAHVLATDGDPATAEAALVLARQAMQPVLGCMAPDDAPDGRLPAIVDPLALSEPAARAALVAAAPGCRSAWCYGDPGVAWSLATMARVHDDAQLLDAAAALAAAAAARPTITAGVVDAGLCHGAVGVALALHEVALATGRADLERAAARWYLVAVDDPSIRGAGDGDIGGYRSRQPAGRVDDPTSMAWVGSPGLLDGTAGIALGLLAALGVDPAAWSGFLMPGTSSARAS